MNKLATNLIRFYQKHLSSERGLLKLFFPYPVCKYNPSCSQYTLEAFAKYNFFKALRLSLTRILKCNPFSKGGNDYLV